MEEEQKLLEQAQMEMEAQEEAEETTALLVRKSRNGNDKNATETSSAVENGVSQTNGHKAHSELVENGAESEEETPAEYQNLNGLLQNDSEAINGDQTPKHLVFYDNVEGIWKCRLCSWAYRNGKVYVDHIQDHKEQLHKLMNLKVFNFESKGVESESIHAGVDQTPGHIKLQISSRVLVDQNSSTSSSSDEEEVDNSNSYEPLKEIESAEVDTINEDNLEVTDLDVEGVLQKQTTHDLYCPNCNSCITKRVILRKRKRVIRVSDQGVKRRPGSILDTGSIPSPSDQVDDDARLLVPNEDDRDKGPDIFRCLSCFSFFIPCGNGLKLFHIFGDKTKKENVRDEQATSVKKNWFTTMFGSDKGKAVDQGNNSQTDVQRGDTVVQSNEGGQTGQPSLSQTPHSSAQASQVDLTLHFPNQRPLINGNWAKGVGDLIDMNGTTTIDATMEQFNTYAGDKSTESKSEKGESSMTLPMTTQVTNVRHGEDAISFSKDDGLALLISERGPLILDDSKQLQMPGQTVEPAVTGHVHPTSQQTITKTHYEYHSQTVNNTSSQQDSTTTQGKDTVITIDTETTETSQTQGVINPTEMPSASQVATQSSGGDRERTESRKEVEIEVVKSIVYGGLAESVTSLSIVASAAGGGAATLNVLALGAANLIGGLFIICHNLWDLKSHRISEEMSNQIVEQSDRYKELLGRRQNFIFHFIVAIISYLIFGLVPPIVYSFAFRESDDQQLKLVVVGAASLLCILILAIGKAYTQSPPKPYMKTVATYVILGFMASGVSYVAGELAERLLNKLGLFQTGPVSNLVVPEMRSTGSGWASY